LVPGLRAEAKHCNAHGTVHGGILATFADVALGYAIAYSTTPPGELLTGESHLDFVASVKGR
jgi:acyl-coenzyme A thioesterase 13